MSVNLKIVLNSKFAHITYDIMYILKERIEEI